MLNISQTIYKTGTKYIKITVYVAEENLLG